jgi:hypothetical protein
MSNDPISWLNAISSFLGGAVPQVLAKFTTYDVKAFPTCETKIIKKYDWWPFSKKFAIHTLKNGKLHISPIE